MRRSRLAALPVAWVLGGALLLSACSTPSPQAQLHDALNRVIVEANERDAAGLRTAVEDLLAVVQELRNAGKIPQTRYDNLKRFAEAVFADADLVDSGVQAEATASAQAEASRSAAAAQATESARAEASRSAAAAEATRSAEAEASRSAAAEASASATPSPTDDPGIVPTSGTLSGGGSTPPAQPSPTPSP